MLLICIALHSKWLWCWISAPQARMGTLPLCSRISISLQHLTTRLGALCRPGLAVQYMNDSLCAGVRCSSSAVSKDCASCSPLEQCVVFLHCVIGCVSRFTGLVWPGNDIVDFQWPKKDAWLDWEAALYALVWLRMVIIEQGIAFDESISFPHVSPQTQSDKLECVVQLMRNPLDIRPTWSTELRKIISAFPPNTKLHFSARALAELF